MRAALKRDRISVQFQWTTKDAFGEESGDWQTLLTLWGNVRLAQAQEQNTSRGTQTAITYEVRIDYRSDIAPRHRIFWKGHILNILTIGDPDGKRRDLLLTAIEYPQGAGNE